jgi:hypothetical protein
MSKLYLQLGFLSQDGTLQERGLLAKIWGQLGGDVEGDGQVYL